MSALPGTKPAVETLPDILMVDDDPGIIQALSKALRALGKLRFATNGADALKMMGTSVPDLVLLDAEMPGMSGLQVLEAVKADAMLVDVPVIVVTSHVEEAFEQMCLEIGAADFIPKPIRPSIVRARASTQLRLKFATDQLKRSASIDGLTGIANRRTFNVTLERELAVAARKKQQLSLLMIDVDFFKKYNDHYGHVRGDGCLVAVARGVQGAMRRPADVVCRYGGEEIAVILPDTAEDGAADVAARVLEGIEALAIPHAMSELGGHVTVSIGSATFDGTTADGAALVTPATNPSALPVQPIDLIGAADKGLYEAKRQGRAQHKRGPAPAALGP